MHHPCTTWAEEPAPGSAPTATEGDAPESGAPKSGVYTESSANPPAPSPSPAPARATAQASDRASGHAHRDVAATTHNERRAPYGCREPGRPGEPEGRGEPSGPGRHGKPGEHGGLLHGPDGPGENREHSASHEREPGNPEGAARATLVAVPGAKPTTGREGSSDRLNRPKRPGRLASLLPPSLRSLASTSARDAVPRDAVARSSRRERFRQDVSASVVVFLIAIPLSLGIALATGAPLQAGLIAAAVGGLVVGGLAGAPLQVSGPAAGLTVVTADLIHAYGWRTTCAITVLAGLAQLVLGCLRVARAALAVSPSIVHAMLAGIGVTVALAQLHVVLGGAPESSALANLQALPGQLLGRHPTATGIGVLTVALLVAWPRLPGRTGAALRRVPAALVAVVTATAVATTLGLSLPRVDLPSWSSHALPEMPKGPALGLLAAVLTVTLVAGVESLLSAVAVDRLHHGSRANLDRELLAQGAGNIVSGGLGGLPVTGVAVRSSANVRAGAASRASTMLHGCWVLACVGLCAALLERIPLAALAALVMVVGVQMVNFVHIRHVHSHREFPVYLVTAVAVVFGGVLEGVALGIATAMVLALSRLARTRVIVEERNGMHWVQVRGQLTFLGVPRLSRALGSVPEGATAYVELEGSYLDHAAYESLQSWRTGHEARGGQVTVHGHPGRYQPDRATKGARDSTGTGGPADGRDSGAPAASRHACRPWTPWRVHRCTRHPDPVARHAVDAGGQADQLIGGVSAFQRNTAPLVREELARLAREGQKPSQLFITCADSRLVTSMITSSGPGDLFTVRNVGNLVPLPDASPAADGAAHTDTVRAAASASGDDSVAAAIEYAVEVLEVGSITVCGHSGCGAMQALVRGAATSGPLARWLRHGAPSLERLTAKGADAPGLTDRPVADDVERLCLINVEQQLVHLMAHPSVARRVESGRLRLNGMYFDFSTAQAYVLTTGTGTPPTTDATTAADGMGSATDSASVTGSPPTGPFTTGNSSCARSFAPVGGRITQQV